MAKHPISIFQSYGELDLSNIPDSAMGNYTELFDSASQILSKTLFTIRELKSQNLADYTEEGRKRIIAQKIVKDRAQLHDTLRKHISQHTANKDRITERINSFSTPTLSDNVPQQISTSMKMAEIRQLLRTKAYAERRELIESSLQNNDPSFLIAVVDSPDSLIHEDTLQQYREQWAFKCDPDLRNYAERIEAMGQLTRKLAGQINSTQIKILSSEKIDDPLPKSQHFLTFIPENDRDEMLAKNMIQSEISEHRKQEMYQEFEKKNGNIDR
jgi:hypothetical protein